MANLKPGKNHEKMKRNIMVVATKSFLKQGYTNTTAKQVSNEANISSGSLTNIFNTKEEILCELVSFVMNLQFSAAETLIKGKTEDKLLFYAAETTLQLHIVEMNENLRDVYSAAYSLPKPSAVIQRAVTEKWEKIFGEYLPGLETKDFYMLEIATGGIMRGFMTIPCDMWFTMEQKVEAFLECTFRLYRIPDEKIKEAIEFVKQFDFKKLAEETVNRLIEVLENGEQ